MIEIFYVASLLFPIFATVTALYWYRKSRFFRSSLISIATMLACVFISYIIIFISLDFPLKIEEQHNPGIGIAYLPLFMVTIACAMIILIANSVIFIYKLRASRK